MTLHQEAFGGKDCDTNLRLPQAHAPAGSGGAALVSQNDQDQNAGARPFPENKQGESRTRKICLNRCQQGHGACHHKCDVRKFAAAWERKDYAVTLKWNSTVKTQMYIVITSAHDSVAGSRACPPRARCTHTYTHTHTQLFPPTV